MTARLTSLTAAILVMLPALILAGVFAARAQRQREMAWQQVRDEAHGLATSLAQSEGVRLAHQRIEVALFPDPPLPQPFTIDRLAQATTPEQLRTLRDDVSAGLSTSGLPLRVLAAARLLEAQPNKDNADSLARLALNELPSILTPTLLERAQHHGEPLSSNWREDWATQQSARQALRQHPQAHRAWVSSANGPWWIERNGERTNMLPPSALTELPVKDAHFRIAGIREPAGPLLANIGVENFPGLSIGIASPQASQIETLARQNFRWSLAMIAVSLVTPVLGLGLIQRTLARERRLNELKSHFVASVSHELRAPVASIRLMADALDEGKVSPHAKHDFHRLISREGKRLSHLIENVLDFARIEQGRKRWHFEATDLRALVADTVKVMQPLAGEKSIALVLSNSSFDAEPAIDADAIQQALINLLDNAIKFSPAHSSIDVSLTADASYCRLAVRDEGPGIPTVEHERIFDRFYRLGDELRRETQGTGIGLSLVKAIAEAHGGKVLLESQPGHGSTFTLHFPSQPTNKS